MNMISIAVVALASGLLGALGMGAGAVLLIYLRVFAGTEQLAAQGINLLFFIPIAVLSILIHSHSHLICWKEALFCVTAGLPTVFLGVWLSGFLSGEILSKLFAGLLIFIGIRELFQKD